MNRQGRLVQAYDHSVRMSQVEVRWKDRMKTEAAAVCEVMRHEVEDSDREVRDILEQKRLALEKFRKSKGV